MFSNLKILVIGDLMLDHYIWGDATRISPEAPVPVVSVERDSYAPGGAANVACNLAGLQVQTALLGSYSDDDGGRRLTQLLEKYRIQLLSHGCKDGLPTIVKTRVLVQRQQMCRIDRELEASQYGIEQSINESFLQQLIANQDAIIISDYAKGVVEDKLLDRIRKQIEMLDERPILVSDPKPKRHLNLCGMDLMTPNRDEALQLAGMPFGHHSKFDAEQVCERIYNQFAPKNLVVTLGAEGMLLCHEGSVSEQLPTEAREVFDVSGAGDTVIATLTAALAAGKSLGDSARLANKAAGIVVSHLGTSPITAEELKATWFV